MTTTCKNLWTQIEDLKRRTAFTDASHLAQEWWSDFESQHSSEPGILIQFLQELTERGATISDFWLTVTFSYEDNVKSNLDYLDHTMKTVGEKRPLEHTDFLDNAVKPIRLI